MIRIIHLILFLTSVHYAFIAYINSTFLGNYISTTNLGIVYAVASLLTIWIVSNLSSTLRKWGQFRTIIAVLTVDLLAILGLAFSASPFFYKVSSFQIGDSTVFVENINGFTPWIPILVTVCFIAFQIAIVLNRALVDIYMEKFSRRENTGSDRGWLLTAMNLAFVISPYIIGQIASDGSSENFWKIYLSSAGFLLLAILIITQKLGCVREIEYHDHHFWGTLRKIIKNKNILGIYVSNFLLEFFYAWMVIYTPIYLNTVIGFSWAEIGTMFSIMLTSFVILELPLGKLADKYLGEKEILTTGFIIAGISTAGLSLLCTKSIIAWTALLFATRVGASAIEVMNDTYFFKKVRAGDADIISFFRNASPLAYLIAPSLASFLLIFVDIRYLFLVLGFIMLSGVKWSLSIKDTL